MRGDWDGDGDTSIGVYDNAGNFAGYLYSKTNSLTQHDNTESAIVYSGGWTTQSVADSVGGSVKYSTASGKTATLSFKGHGIAWVSGKGATFGSGSVAIDGGTAKTVDLNASSTSYRNQVLTKDLSSNGTHSLVLSNLGTASHSRVEVDAFYVLRNV